MPGQSRIKSFVSGLAVGSLAAALLAQKQNALPLLPARRIWQRTLAGETGELPAAMTIGKTQARYLILLADRPYFSHPALRQHLEKHILPGLALYQVLKEETGDATLAQARVGLLLDAEARQSYRSIQPLSKLPLFFPVFRLATRLMMAYNFPPAGWEIEWVRDDAQAIAFNIKSCIYLKVLTVYAAPELTPIFCHSDDAAMEGFDSLVFERTNTLGRGGEMCDFCYRKVN